MSFSLFFTWKKVPAEITLDGERGVSMCRRFRPTSAGRFAQEEVDEASCETSCVFQTNPGIRFLEWLRGDQPRLAEATLLVTGGSNDEESSRFIAENPDRVVIKPVDARALRSKLRAILARHQNREDN